MEVLVACEESGVVRDAFIAAGHRAMSCDLLPSRSAGPHYEGSVMDVIDYPWDLMIGHPPCTHTSVSGARWFADKWASGEQAAGVAFFMSLVRRSAHIPSVALEQPISIMSRLYRKPDQIIQPWQFGHGEQKATCLWLKGLPLLLAADVVEGREQKVWKMPPSDTRARDRSATYGGIARAMAVQWGSARQGALYGG